MFTIKYIMTDGTEMLDGPFGSVSFSIEDEDGRKAEPGKGWGVVRATRNLAQNDGGVVYGPILRSGGETHDPIVYVMNERGATVATYRL